MRKKSHPQHLTISLHKFQDYRYWIKAEVKNTSSLVAHNVKIVFKTIDKGRKTGEFVFTTRQLAPEEIWEINKGPHWENS